MMPMCSAPLLVPREELRVEVDRRVHRDVVHVLQAADDLHVLGAGHDRMRRLVDRLQAAAAQPVDRRPAGLDGSPAIRPTMRATLNPCSLCCCVLPRTTSSITAGSMPVRSTSARTTATARSSRAHVAKDALLGVRPANRRAAAINNDSGFHGSVLIATEARSSQRVTNDT